jgi:dihydroneopterin aldolase
MGFDDRAAHHMALLAMEQFAVAIVALQPGCVGTASLDAIRRARQEGLVPVWLPTKMALAAADIPASWEVTSDSLAAWLTGKLEARRILLVKHGVNGGDMRIGELVARGIVDPRFAQHLGAGRTASIAGPADHAAAATAIRLGRSFGYPIDMRDQLAVAPEAAPE